MILSVTNDKLSYILNIYIYIYIYIASYDDIYIDLLKLNLLPYGTVFTVL